MTTSAASQTQELVEQLKQEEAQLQQRMVEIDAQLQYAEQVRCRAWWGSLTIITNNIDNNNELGWGSMLSHHVQNRCQACTDPAVYDTKLLYILLPIQSVSIWLGSGVHDVSQSLLCCDVCWQISVLRSCLHSTSNSMDTRIGPVQVWNTGVVGRLLTANLSMCASKHTLFVG